MEKLINLIENNARLSNSELSAMLGISEQEVAEKISKLEDDGIIRGYTTLINWDKLDAQHVTALIEIRVMPKLGLGFDEIANRITQIKEVESVYLMSGAYDLAVTVKGKTFQEIAMFVAKRLSPLDSVVSTTTHFILRRYKDDGIELDPSNGDDRGTISL